MPWANCSRASWWRFLASSSDTSGYLPKATSLYLPSNRYLKRQSFPPDGSICRYRPPPSNSLRVLVSGFAFFMVISVSAKAAPSAHLRDIRGYLFFLRVTYPQKYPRAGTDFSAHHRMALDSKKRESHVVVDYFGLPRISQDCRILEVVGVEPTSKKCGADAHPQAWSALCGASTGG